MTEQEREELIEKMARHIAVAEETTDPNSEWCDENWHCWIPEARAALAVAEPVIREQADIALREENARLREALKPFAGMAQHCEGMSDSESQCVFVGDLRAARAALKGERG